MGRLLFLVDIVFVRWRDAVNIQARLSLIIPLFAMIVRPGLLGITVYLSIIVGAEDPKVYKTNCSSLGMGQFICPDPSYDYIDPKTQQPYGCTQKNVAKGNIYYHLFELCLWLV